MPSEFPQLRGMERQAPLAGTVTVVMAEGRRVIRLFREVSPSVFGALINEYQRLLRDVMERMGGLNSRSSRHRDRGLSHSEKGGIRGSCPAARRRDS